MLLVVSLTARAEMPDPPDALLLLRMNDPKNVLPNEGFDPLDTNPRVLAAVLADAKGFHLAFQNAKLIARNDSPNMADAFGSLELVKNTFDLRLVSFASEGTWWAGNSKFRFRYQAGCFRLIGYDTISQHRASHETDTRSVNYLNGAALRTHSMSDDDKPTTEKQKLKSTKPVCIEAMGDGLDFQPER